MDSDLIDVIKSDHKELEECYNRYKSSTTTMEANKWFYMFLLGLCRHSIAEEVIVYEMMESVSDLGKGLGMKSREDHMNVKLMLEDLRKITSDISFDVKFDDIFKHFWEHVLMEEKEDLPFIQQNIPLEKRQIAAKYFTMRTNLEPSFPQTEIPDRSAALDMALGLLLKPPEKLKEIFMNISQQSGMVGV